jgi:hypothetical protein
LEKEVCHLIVIICTASNEVSTSVLRKAIGENIPYIPTYPECDIEAYEKNGEGSFMMSKRDEIRLLIDQVIFDILYDKYLADSPRLTLNKYCEEYIDYNWDNSVCNEAIKNAIIEEKYNPALRAEAEKLGIPSELYNDCIRLALLRTKSKKGEKLKANTDSKNNAEKFMIPLDLCSNYKKLTLGKGKAMDVKEFQNDLALKAKATRLEIPTDSYIKCISLALKKASKINADNFGIVSDSYFKDVKLALIKAKYDSENIIVKNMKKNKPIIEDARKLGVDPELYFDCLVKAFIKAKNRATKAMRAEIKHEAAIKNNPKMREDFKKHGVNDDKYIDCFATLNDFFKTDKQRPKCAWDYIFYNAYFITSKQYDRTFGIDRKNRNYYYNEFIDDYNYCDNFVKTFMPTGGNINDDYFRKSMDFYHLEIYKRLDFIYKLAVRMESEGMVSIDKEDLRVKRFHPVVFLPHADDENKYLKYCEKHKYYKPLLMIEEQWQEQKNYYTPAFFDVWQEQHLIRAKVYELFKYNYIFDSKDYEDISNFIHSKYDILSYHEKEKKWLNTEKNPREQTQRIQNAEKINAALFWDSDKRIPNPL